MAKILTFVRNKSSTQAINPKCFSQVSIESFLTLIWSIKYVFF